MSDLQAKLSQNTTLRLALPQWQGAGESTVADLLDEVPLSVARRGYAIGSQVLELLLPPHDGPTATVPVDMSDSGIAATNGVEARDPLIKTLRATQQTLSQHTWERILVLGGECSVSVAPFAELAHRYGDDLAVIWVDSHPDVTMPESAYDGFHAMALSALTGHGDPEIVEMLPTTINPRNVALAGIHVVDEEEQDRISSWGLTVFAPNDLRNTSDDLLAWLATSNCSRVAIHFDVDCIDSNDLALGLGRESGGLTSSEVRGLIADIDEAVDVVGLTVAEFIPRDVLIMQNLLSGFPLI